MTNWNTEGLVEQSDSPVAADFLPLLKDALAPLLSLPARPILLARVTQYSPSFPGEQLISSEKFSEFFPNVSSKSILHVQYGPRAWRTDSLFWPGMFTTYGEPLRKAIETLEAGKWSTLAGALLFATLRLEPPADQAQSDVGVIARADGCFLVLRRPARDTTIVYEIADSGLHLLGLAHPRCFRRLDQARRTLLWPKENDASTRMTKEQLREDVLWRYTTKLADATRPIFLEAFDKMRAIAPEVALAYSAARFNDACGDDNWSAVRVNNFAWESGCYFENGAAALAAAPPAIHMALGLLHHLLACRIAMRFTASFGMEVEPLDAIGFFLQEGDCYFSCSCTNGDDGPVYRVDPWTGEAQFVGVADRFDWNFNTGPTGSFRATPARNCLEWTPLDIWLEQIPSNGEEARATYRGCAFKRLAGVDWEEYFHPGEG